MSKIYKTLGFKRNKDEASFSDFITFSLQSKLLKGFRKYRTQKIFREIRMKLLFSMARPSSLKDFETFSHESHFKNIKHLWSLRDIRLKLLSRLEKFNLLKVLGSHLIESHLLSGFQKYKHLGS